MYSASQKILPPLRFSVYNTTMIEDTKALERANSDTIVKKVMYYAYS